jgi:hypothetical protein
MPPKDPTRPERPSARLATAYHEAGHAVVSFALELAVTTVSIRGGDEYHGVCLKPNVLHYNTSSRQERRRIARDMIVSAYAGMHAQRLVDPDPPEHHGDSDDAEAFDLSRQWDVLPRGCGCVGDDRHLAYLDRLRAEAGRLAMRHRGPIEALAGALLLRTELSGEEAKAAAGMTD